MQTVDKAMKLLGFFSPAEPEIGLSDLARLAAFDKAATRRFLVALSSHGFIEQNPENRKYRLGSAFLRFARVREATMPLGSIIQPALGRLALATGETAHASLLAGHELTTIGVAEPQRATRVHLDPSEPLPLHATASGQCCLAFSNGALGSLFAKGRLRKHTDKTASSRKELRHILAETFRRGYGRADRSFEAEVIGTAAPLFDWAGKPFGAVAVAAIASRYSTENQANIIRHILATAVEITRATGGEAHPNVLAALKAQGR